MAPDTNTEYLFYQTLIGIWPTPRPGRRADDLPDRSWFENAHERVERYMLKAVKEAKTKTSWTEPDDAYETALKQFIGAVLTGEADSPFLLDVGRFVGQLATAGHWNALSRVLLHLTSPGVADTYQGDELWFFALVDPDNRRPVDYKQREELLAAVEPPGSLRGLHPSDERTKLGVVQRVLDTRRDHAALFTGGSYTPLEVRGAMASHVIAVARSSETTHAIVIAPRLIVSLVSPDTTRLDWKDTEVLLPEVLRGRSLKMVLEDRDLGISSVMSSLALAEALTDLPFALLLSL
jgi:(1->4)-alpha-D-glucan 1-alpha-D-glucosylmutase